MLTVEVLAQRDLDPDASHVQDVRLLDLASQHPRRAWLRVYGLAGAVVSLGRYHVAPAGDPAACVRLHRRLGGGRVSPLGPGFVVLSLTLPHRSALVAEQPLALRPEQVLNRCVRALLAALRGLGVDAFYPGRDRINVEGRTLGLVSLESDARGATVFESVLAVDGDWVALPGLVAAVDRDGVIAVEEVPPEQVTTLAAYGVTPTLDELAHCLAGSYAQQFGLELTAGTESTIPPDGERRGAAWIASRRLRPGLDRHAIALGQLGVLEVYLSASGSTIADVLLAGDFIADSPSLERLEQRLRGCALAPAAIAAVVDAVYADTRSFLLGVGPLHVLVDTIMRAA